MIHTASSHTIRPRRRFRRKGAAAAELAILLPFLCFLFVVAVDYCRIFYFSVTVQNCSRNGALYACDPLEPGQSSYADVTASARADAPNVSPAPGVTSANGVDADGNSYVEVTVTHTFNSVTKYPGIPSSVDLSRTVRMRKLPQVPK